MSDEKKVIPAKIEYFSTDDAVMYLIQKVTGKPTHEILGFFFDLATRVAEIGAANIKGRGVDKKIIDYYPDSDVPFLLKVKGNVRRWACYDKNTRQYKQDEHESLCATVEVSFPEASSSQDQEKISEMVMEAILLGGSNMPAFKKPDTKTPRMYKKLMAEICAKRSGNEPV